MPLLPPFSITLNFEEYTAGQKLAQINSVDVDGDEVSHELLSGNFDLDGDLQFAIQISSTGSVVNDPDDMKLSWKHL